MKIEVADNVAAFLSERGRSDVTIEVEDLETPCCVGRMPEMRIRHQPPFDPTGYRHFETGGITLHLSKLLHTGDTVRVYVSGIGPFKKIEVSGIHLIL
ncbi:CC/Se motif family (seleno)protein [Nitrospina gracilis]|uniref:CC/Se motif family (seleno)protein n=1 Tax=Nitrospina gracilis TaxID=35801 RepID=UPI001F48D38A|nr:CC/Se motif family (seleno)protein [Nitrospina gracilis]MCF8720075.1 hypothetical protein [Nitrospina gracilis Nb-211]